jgi:predicted TIM-barrel fold metal-dependent hydrolase
MIDGMLVVDAVVHAYNFAPENVRDNPVAKATYDLIYDASAVCMPEGRVMPRKIALTDWSAEVVSQTLFRETATDLAAHHYLRLDSWFKDGLVSREKNVEMATRWPQRYFSYVGVDPTRGIDVCLRDLKEQLEEIPHAVGLKLYPHQIYPFTSFRMDDPAAFPLWEAAAEAGIKVIAVHKAQPLGPVPLDPYRPGDVDGAAIAFPELNFEIIHSGMAFVEETAMAVSRFPNVYANLEVTTFLLPLLSRRFGEALGALMATAPNKVLWSGALPTMVDIQYLLELFVAYEFPEDVAERVGFQLTRELKAGVLGLNYLEMVGADPEAAMAAIADDEFSEFNDGRPLEPWGTARRLESPELFV